MILLYVVLSYHIRTIHDYSYWDKSRERLALLFEEDSGDGAASLFTSSVLMPQVSNHTAFISLRPDPTEAGKILQLNLNQFKLAEFKQRNFPS